MRVEAVRPGAGTHGANLRTFREGWLFFPPAVEMLEYDLDGNLISDPRWTYGWDGESSRGTEARCTADFAGYPEGVGARVERPNHNRLIGMEEKVIPGTGIRPARQRLEFGYDGQSRRVMKRVLVKTSEASEWSLRQERRFLYDGWNMIGELDVPSSGQARFHRSYAWGLDASGTLTGAGGVGGLVLTSHHTPQADGGTQVTTLAPLYDFNGNVLAYADVATSTITHRMEYDPFGQELSLDTLLPGDGAAEAPRFRFSTKYTDGETGLVYYGYRYYSPELGRWPSRDPIEERGGLNLYGMVANDPANRVDVLGLLPQACYRPMMAQDWMGSAAIIWHAFIRFSDGTTDSNLGAEPRGYTSSHTVCINGEIRDDFGAKLPNGTPCGCASEDEIDDCVRKHIRSCKTNGFPFANNCGSNVRDAFLDCCLKNPTPRFLYYPGGSNSG